MTHYQTLTLQFTSTVDFPPFSSSLNPSTKLSSHSSAIHLHRSFPGSSFRLPKSGVCWAASPGSPLPESDPPPDKHVANGSDLGAAFSKAQDRMQIFFAVLFWMSLFFWNCAWNDGSNDDGPNKKSQFRR